MTDMTAKRIAHAAKASRASQASSAPQPPHSTGLHPAVRADGDHLVLSVRVTPRAARNAVALTDHHLLVRLTAPPVDGAANDALLALLAERLHMPRRALTLVRGAASREKLVAVQGLTDVEAVSALLASQ